MAVFVYVNAILVHTWDYTISVILICTCLQLINNFPTNNCISVRITCTCKLECAVGKCANKCVCYHPCRIHAGQRLAHPFILGNHKAARYLPPQHPRTALTVSTIDLGRAN